MPFRAPVADIAFALKHGAQLNAALADGLFGDLCEDDVDAVLAEAGRFATDVIAPLNAIGDRHGTPFKDGAVTTPPGWKEAYRDWAAGGWNGLASPAAWGGQGLPHALNAACIEMWNAASMAFGIGPVLTMGAVEALAAYGTERLEANLSAKARLRRMDGHDAAHRAAGRLRCRRAAHARPSRADDGSYRIFGQKIFITYGEHDLTDNIIHFVLARLPDAPAGTKGISLFLVPKFWSNADGSLGARNDVARAFDRAQARHPCLADLHHGLWRQRRRGRLSDRRGKPRARLHVHDDEPWRA